MRKIALDIINMVNGHLHFLRDSLIWKRIKYAKID